MLITRSVISSGTKHEVVFSHESMWRCVTKVQQGSLGHVTNSLTSSDWTEEEPDYSSQFSIALLSLEDELQQVSLELLNEISSAEAQVLR